MKRDAYSQVAESVPFDPTVSPSGNLTSDSVQGAIDELANRVAVSASPGFTWGRSGTVTANTWLSNDSVPSNTSGRTIFLNNATIEKIYVANEDPTILTLEFYHHDGSETNLTLIGQVTTTATRTNTFTVSYSVPTGKQLAVKIKAGSNAAKNIVVGALLRGSST
jgi:hypothetical protein